MRDARGGIPRLPDSTGGKNRSPTDRCREGEHRSVVATLGLKEMSQSILVRKLCTLSPHHPTRKAIFEFDKLVRSIYTLP
jgi:hypothetical protein